MCFVPYSAFDLLESLARAQPGQHLSTLLTLIADRHLSTLRDSLFGACVLPFFSYELYADVVPCFLLVSLSLQVAGL